MSTYEDYFIKHCLNLELGDFNLYNYLIYRQILDV